jgi:peptide chain release factor 3
MPCRFTGARWITADTPAAMKKFTDENASRSWRWTPRTPWPT